ncbi:MAG: hypothetical protein ACR2F6_08495 [Mycobacteriales bacterium]
MEIRIEYRATTIVTAHRPAAKPSQACPPSQPGATNVTSPLAFEANTDAA